MSSEDFWTLIESTKNTESQVASLTEELKLLTPEEIIQFEKSFNEFCYMCHVPDLWAAAYITMGGCSDENFQHFKYWIIAQGSDVFYEVIKNPDSLSEHIPHEYSITGEVPELEELQYVSLDAYYLKKNGSIGYDEELENEFNAALDTSLVFTSLPHIVIDWTDEEHLKTKFPKLWERFGQNPLS